MRPKIQRRTKARTSEHSLIANIRTNKLSYFIASQRLGPTSEKLDEEAIIELTAQISSIDPNQSDHVGALIECSLVCARSFSDDENTSARPTLYSLNLGRNDRTMLVYLPADAFWALQSQFFAGNLQVLELKYEKPKRDRGDIISLHIY